MVAAFHSLVGLAAVTTSIANFMLHDPSDSDFIHNITAYLGTFIGAVTLTGSATAFGKLDGFLDSKPLNLPGKNLINIGLAGGSALAGLIFLASGSPAIGLACLTTTSITGGVLGAHMTASIGGADMPVVITLLNSYSGYALVAEGLMLQNDLMTAVGALIGSSGAILSYIMCRAMNRSLANVILGGYEQKAPTSSEGEQEVKTHQEIDSPSVADSLAQAKNVIIVPGYGLAVAKA